MDKVTEIVGYQLQLDNGKTWRIDKNTLENSRGKSEYYIEL